MNIPRVSKLYKESLAAMPKLLDSKDHEIAHKEADDIICSMLCELGCGKLVREYDKIYKWYA